MITYRQNEPTQRGVLLCCGDLDRLVRIRTDHGWTHQGYADTRLGAWFAPEIQSVGFETDTQSYRKPVQMVAHKNLTLASS